MSTITTPIFTRLLTRAEYGQYSVFNSWMSILGIFVTLNLYAGVFEQGLVKFEDEKKQFASAIQGLVMTLSLVWVAIYLPLRSFWNEIFSLTTVQMLAMSVLIWASAAFNLWAVEQRVALRYRHLVILTTIISVAQPIIGVIFVVNSQDKVTARILGLALVDAVGYSWLALKQIRAGKVFFSRRIWKYVLLFNLPLLPHYLSMNVLSSADRIMINDMLSSGDAGIYNLAYNISLIMTMFNTALLQTIDPWLFRKMKENRIDAIAKVAYPTFVFIAGLNLILMLFAPEVVRFFAPPSYFDAIWIIPPVAMSVYFMFTYGFFSSFEFYQEKQLFVAIASSIGAVLNVVLNYIFLPVFGFYAAGYTTLACYILYAAFHYIFSRRICRLVYHRQAYDAKYLLGITGIFMFFGFTILCTYNYALIRYTLLGVVAILLCLKRKAIRIGIERLIMVRKQDEASSSNMVNPSEEE